MKSSKLTKSLSYINDEMILNATKAPRRSSFIRIASIAASLILIIGIFTVLSAGSGVNAVIAIDVNPSIEIDIDKKDKVLSVRALNEDAETVLGDMDLKKVDIEIALNAIVGSMLKNGYITKDKNSLLISVDSKDKNKAETLTAVLTKDIEERLSEDKIEASLLTQLIPDSKETEEKAKENHISRSKAALIEKIVSYGLADTSGIPYTYEALANMNVNELKLLIEKRNADISGVSSSGHAAESGYIGKDAALMAALTHAGITRENAANIEAELDYERGKMVYDVEFKTADLEFDYDIDAKTGEILKSESEQRDKYDDDGKYDDIFGNGDNGGNGGIYGDEDKFNETAPNTNENIMYSSNALDIALKHAGLVRDNVYDIEAELENERGRYIYEISFKSAGFEYDYDIDAKTGEIVKWEKEFDD